MRFLCAMGLHRWHTLLDLKEIGSDRGCLKKSCKRCGITKIIYLGDISVRLGGLLEKRDKKSVVK